MRIARAKDAARKRKAYWKNPERSRAQLRAKRLRNLERCQAQAKARYWRNLEKFRAQSRERAKTPRARLNNNRAVARYREARPEIVAAQTQARAAVRRGELRVSLVCEIKGCRETRGLHLHHVDYRRPRDTIRACAVHHEHLHHRGKLELKPGAGRKWARAPRGEVKSTRRTSRTGSPRALSGSPPRSRPPAGGAATAQLGRGHRGA
jgi:hypothetical protein